jgi:hypothetical protein
MSDWIAEESFTAHPRLGGRMNVTARLARPHRLAEDEYACAVALDGLHENLPEIHAVSSLQAVCLAASLLRNVLSDFVERGGRLKYGETDEDVDIAACFGNIGSSRSG